MRKAFERMVDFYKTPIGQDLMETTAGAAVAATGQALFTDMTPEEIALATAIGFGVATVGRPIFGTIGEKIGNRLDKIPHFKEEMGQVGLDNLIRSAKMFSPAEAVDAKLAPYAHMSPSAQLGQIIGRAQGDNIMQGIVAIAAPSLMPKDDKDE